MEDALSRAKSAFLAGLTTGMIITCLVWMATYWPDAAARDRRIEACEARVGN